MLIAGLLEFPFNRSGIYEVFAMISIALLCLFPFVTTGINATSIAFHILALRQNESKVKNIVMMAISILYDVVIIAFFICFFRGLWGYSGIFFVNACHEKRQVSTETCRFSMISVPCGTGDIPLV